MVYCNSMDNYINASCWTIISLFVFHFIMPHVGLRYDGTFFIVGAVIAKNFYAMMDNSAIIIADIEEGRTISYDMTLPISHTFLFTKIAISHAIYSVMISLWILPLSKLLLWNHLHFPYFTLYKFLIIIFVTALFAGFFSLFIIGQTKSLQNIEDVYSGILFPLVCLGCYQFTWKSMAEVSPMLAYLNFLNPIMYMFEGIRSATLDPSLSLPFWACIFALLLYTIPIGYLGIRMLKKRLDAI